VCAKREQQATQNTVQLWQEIHGNRTDWSLQCKRCEETIWRGSGKVDSREAWAAVHQHSC
jgi:hypothetical protein